MIQEATQATAQAIAQLTAYAPTLLADNAARYPIVLIVNLVSAILFSVITWKLANRSIMASRDYDTEGLAIAFGGVTLILGIVALVCIIVSLDQLTYINHPDIWALKDLVSAATR